MRRISLGFALAVAIIVSSASARATMVFSTLTNPSLAGRLPGPDGLVGTADDVISAGANPFGSTSYTHAMGVAPGAGGDFYTFGVGTTQVNQPFQQVGSQFETDQFSISLHNQATTGYASTSIDLPTLPHSMITQSVGLSVSDFTTQTCLSLGPGLCLDSAFHMTGFTLLRGVDPMSYSSLNPTAASYLSYLATLAPANWTAISLQFQAPTDLTAANTGGTLAPLFIGGQQSAVSVLVTSDPIQFALVPEPSVLTLLLASGLFFRSCRG